MRRLAGRLPRERQPGQRGGNLCAGCQPARKGQRLLKLHRTGFGFWIISVISQARPAGPEIFPLPGVVRLRTPFIFAALLFSLPLVRAAEAPAPAPHPLTGSWSWTLAQKPCTERLEYRAGGMRHSSSGEEMAQSRYHVSPIPSLLGFYRLTEAVTESNAKADCAGDVHEAGGEPVTRYLQFSPKKDQLIVCREESLKACFGPLKRLPDQ